MPAASTAGGRPHDVTTLKEPAVLHASTTPRDPDPVQLLSVRELPAHSPDQATVAVVGEIDAYTAPLLEACLRTQTRRRGLRELAIDLRQVTFLDATGLSVLARALRRCRLRGARLVLRCGRGTTVLRLVQASGLAAVVTIDREHWTEDAGERQARYPRLALQPAGERR
jgi:anti-sigma B factor antagonist